MKIVTVYFCIWMLVIQREINRTLIHKKKEDTVVQISTTFGTLNTTLQWHENTVPQTSHLWTFGIEEYGHVIRQKCKISMICNHGLTMPFLTLL